MMVMMIFMILRVMMTMKLSLEGHFLIFAISDIPELGQ